MKNRPYSAIEVQTYDLELDGKSYKYHRWVDGIDGRVLDTDVEPMSGEMLDPAEERAISERLEEMVEE